jgi:hypothetical protein
MSVAYKNAKVNRAIARKRGQVMLVAIYSNGEFIGAMDTEDFRRAWPLPGMPFLREYVDHYNRTKESQGEPERADIVLRDKFGDMQPTQPKAAP